ncbi:MAG: hypothetical protein ACM31C_15700 [Acidobacteriota bacterium]
MRVDQDRSQPIMRLPVDRVPARVTLEDGRQLESWLFVPVGDDVAEMFGKPEAFLPVDTGTGILIVARAVIAAVLVRRARLETSDDLPVDRQPARVHLRGGQVVEGELRWTAAPGYRRTVDLMNDPSRHVVVHAREGVTYVAKAQIAWIEEA